MNMIIRALFGRFLPPPGGMLSPAVREIIGARTGLVGIGVNLLLFAAKLAIGIHSGAISVIADALNNLSDAGSAIVLLLGFRFAALPADPEHPFGHGRIEYLTGLFVAIVILLVGVQLAQSSVEKILRPETLAVNALTCIVLFVSILVKLGLAAFYRTIGKCIHSEAIETVAKDSLADCLTTSAVLVSLGVYAYADVNIDGIAGVFVAAFILYSGWNAVKSTIQPLMGEPPDPALVDAIRRAVLDTDGILGMHDLIVHAYGPGRIFASLHAEVPAETNLLDAHTIVDALEQRLKTAYGISVIVHMDPVVIDDPETNRLRARVADALRASDPCLSMHDFRLTVCDDGERELYFDVAVAHRASQTDNEIRETLERALQAPGEHYTLHIHFDHQYC